MEGGCRRADCRFCGACVEDHTAKRADPEEIEQGAAEGILIHPSKSINRILVNNGKVIGAEFLDVESFAFDEDRNLQLETVENSQQIIEADTMSRFPVASSPFPVGL